MIADRDISAGVAREIERRFSTGGHIAFIAPALTKTRFAHMAGNADEARDEAEERVDASVSALEEAGIESEPAAVGDQDPVVAIEDLLREYGDLAEVVMVNHAGDEQRWAEHDAFDRVRRRVHVPVTVLEVDGDERIVDDERSLPGEDEAAEPEVKGGGENLPRFSLSDFLAIIVAIVGTLALFVLAADAISSSDDPGDQGDPGGIGTAGIVTALLAIGFFLINTWHVIGLVMFESVGYRGIGAKFFAYLSLIGTPAAVVIALLIR